MKLEIFEKLRPFSHEPGCSFILPGTSLAFTFYPTVLRWIDLSVPSRCGELLIKVTGPVKGFTAQLDLERGYIAAWGEAAEGHFKYRIHPNESNFVLEKLKDFEIEGSYREGKKEDSHEKLERLHLGVSKKLDWELVKRRDDLKELIPLWYALSQQVPKAEVHEGPSLYEQCRIMIEQRDIVNIGSALLALYKCSFGKTFIPRLHDEDHYGFPLPPFSADSPVAILSQSRHLLKSLFFTVNESTVNILPALPVEFHCGKLIQVNVNGYGELDIEWTKKSTRRVVFRCERDAELTFSFQKRLRNFKLRVIGEQSSRVIECGAPLTFHAGKSYLFDNFSK